MHPGYVNFLPFYDYLLPMHVVLAEVGDGKLCVRGRKIYVDGEFFMEWTNLSRDEETCPPARGVRYQISLFIFELFKICWWNLDERTSPLPRG